MQVYTFTHMIYIDQCTFVITLGCAISNSGVNGSGNWKVQGLEMCVFKQTLL